MVAAVFALGSVSSTGCKGKSKNEGDETKKVTPKTPAKPTKPAPTDPTKAKDKAVERPPVPTGFAGKATAFYANAAKLLKAEKDCAKLGAHLLVALKSNESMLKAYVGTAQGTKWREANKALVTDFETQIRETIPRCAMDKTFRNWMQRIQALAARHQHDTKGDGTVQPPQQPTPEP